MSGGPPYFSGSVLGNAAWRILTGQVPRQDTGVAVVDPEQLRRDVVRASEICHRCELHRRYGPSMYGCWHEAALLLLDHGLRPWSLLP
jgi:hypothetical protein